MADKKYILVSMDDERARKIADVLGNKTSKKIIDFLSEKNEASEKEISEALKIPMNTVEYNLKKLLGSELIEKTKNFFWSKKGKKIPMYKLSNKSILISPRKRINSQIKTILPVALISGVAALIVRKLTFIENAGTKSSAEMLQAAAAQSSGTFSSQSQTSLWFFIGACFAIIIFVLLSLRKIDKDEKKSRSDFNSNIENL